LRAINFLKFKIFLLYLKQLSFYSNFQLQNCKLLLNDHKTNELILPFLNNVFGIMGKMMQLADFNHF